MFERPIHWLRSLPIVPLTWNSELQKLEAHRDRVSSVAFSPDDLLLASASNNGTIRLWNVMTGEQVQQLRHGHDGIVHNVIFSPDRNSRRLASATQKEIMLWDIATGERLLELDCNSHFGDSVVFSSDGHLLFSASSEKRMVMVWNAVTGELVRRRFSVRSIEAIPITISPNSELFASSEYSTRKTITIQRTTTGQRV